jgi:uncharacterized protein YukJ
LPRAASTEPAGAYDARMPLAHYGILKGNLFTPQEQTYQGQWFHGVFYVTVPAASLPRRCVTDFSSANRDRIQYKVFTNLEQALFARMAALPDGYTELARTAASGAFDYARSAILGPAARQGWIVSDGVDAVRILQDHLSAGPAKVFVFGEPFTDAAPQTDAGVQSQNGMHNVHMNQGDPAHSSDGRDHQADDGIWQDGATIFQNADGSLTAFCSKFVSQTFDTDDRGLPTRTVSPASNAPPAA